jgi:hypothetical protein
MNFTIPAIAFNIQKLYKKKLSMTENYPKQVSICKTWTAFIIYTCNYPKSEKLIPLLIPIHSCTA